MFFFCATRHSLHLLLVGSQLDQCAMAVAERGRIAAHQIHGHVKESWFGG